MATLTAARRKALPASSFAYPATRRYPIDTKARARNALSRAAQRGTSGTYQTVARKVRAKYGEAIPTVGRKRGTVTRAGFRKGGATRRTGAMRSSTTMRARAGSARRGGRSR